MGCIALPVECVALPMGLTSRGMRCTSHGTSHAWDALHFPCRRLPVRSLGKWRLSREKSHEMHAWDASLIPVDFSCDIHRVSHRTTHEMHCARHVDSLTACNAPSHCSLTRVTFRLWIATPLLLLCSRLPIAKNLPLS